ncbi:retrovirus-related pol polyprotein from transposon TNT 1-94 [Tanacetum coccineum]
MSCRSVMALKVEIHRLHLNGITVVGYYSKLTPLWDKLANLTKASTCVCRKFTYKAPKEHAREKEDEKLMQFLLGLHDNFGTVRLTILNMDPLPTVRELLVLLERNKEGSDNISAKLTTSYFPLSDINAIEYFDLIHYDIWGPYGTPTSCGAHYFLTLVDDRSRDVWAYLMRDKGVVKKILD